MKRTRIRPVSTLRTMTNVERQRLLTDTFGPREEWRCQFHQFYDLHPEVPITPDHLPHHGDINGHEIIKRSRGGSILDMNNVVLLCNYHNGFCEDFPLTASKLGLADHWWDQPNGNKTTARIKAMNAKNFPEAP